MFDDNNNQTFFQNQMASPNLAQIQSLNENMVYEQKRRKKVLEIWEIKTGPWIICQEAISKEVFVFVLKRSSRSNQSVSWGEQQAVRSTPAEEKDQSEKTCD